MAWEDDLMEANIFVRPRFYLEVILGSPFKSARAEEFEQSRKGRLPKGDPEKNADVIITTRCSIFWSTLANWLGNFRALIKWC